MTQVFTQGEPNLVKNPIDVSSDTSLSLPETLSLPSTPPLGHIATTPFPPNFPTNLDARYRENSTNNIPLRLDWNTYVAPLRYLVNTPIVIDYTLNTMSTCYNIDILQYRHEILKNLQKHNIQILTQDNSTLKFEITVRLNNIIHHSLPLATANKTVQSLTPPFITPKIIYKFVDTQKRHLEI